MILFRNVQIFDGSGAAPFPGEVLIKGNRIVDVVRTADAAPAGPGLQVIDGHGTTLMPGMTEAHAHLSWPSSVERFVPGMNLPPEELAPNTARNARILLDHGFTSAYSGGALGKTVEITLAARIGAGELPGPRLLPASIEREPPNETDYLAGEAAARHGTGPEAIRAFVRECAASGARIVKFLLSGESALKPGASMQTLYSEEEIRAAGETARECGVWLTGHAHCAEAIKMGVRNGFRVLYHCTYADAEAIDMLAARKADIFIAPTLGIVQATLDAIPPPHFDMSHMKADAANVLEQHKRLGPELVRRGVRLLPGGDYGFPFNPNGRNARDLELFVRYLGFSPVEALVAVTRYGGEIMGMPNELGQIKPGYLADLLLIRGDPTRDISILQDQQNLIAIMKDGRFHKSPAMLS
ncbi:MAG TPA: amidohydrolase family protein [Steroidobacteraceae bacterium]